MKKKTKSRAAPLTELEGCVLGMIATRGPCTPYAIRREFRASPSRHWSASAGAIYPLVVRLQQRGLVGLERKTGDRRGARLYTLTAAGQRALRAWLGPPCLPLAAGVPPDPLRNRVAFLAVLDAQQQADFFDDALCRVRGDLQKIVSYAERNKAEGDTLEYLVSCGSYRMMQARLDWLRETARCLGHSTKDGEPGK
jgi:DNA-binding PadR family transcriptional regulator